MTEHISSEEGATGTDEQPQSEERISLNEAVGRRTAMGAIVATLGLAGLTGQVSGQSDIGTASNPYRWLFVSQGVVFVGVTSSSGLPEGTFHVRSDLV